MIHHLLPSNNHTPVTWGHIWAATTYNDLPTVTQYEDKIIRDILLLFKVADLVDGHLRLPVIIEHTGRRRNVSRHSARMHS